MPYCTLADLITEFTEPELVQLTDVDGTGRVNTATIDRAIKTADRLINRRLAGRSALPLAADDVTDLACHITRYYLYTTDVPALVKERFEFAVKELEKMAKGESGVVNSTGDVAVTVSGVEMVSSGHVFGRDASGFL